MRKFISSIAAILLMYNVFAQPEVKQRTDYLQKSKKKKTTGWILLGGGVITSFIGLTQFNFAGSDDGHVNNTTAGVLLGTGVAASLISIPFFSASKRNKKLAMSLSFKSEKTTQIKNSGLVYQPMPAVSLKINL